MHGIDGSNQKVRSSFCQLFRRRKHKFGDTGPVVRIDALHVVGEVVAVHGDFRVAVRTKQLPAFGADRAVTERGALSAASDDADVQGHSGQWPEISGQSLLNREPLNSRL